MVTPVCPLKQNLTEKGKLASYGGSGRKRVTELLYNSEQRREKSEASEVTLGVGGAEVFGGTLNGLN